MFHIFHDHSPSEEAGKLPGEAHQQSLDGKVAIVTGANAGLGKAISMKLGQLRCRKVILACRNLQSAEETASAIRRQTQNKTTVVAKHLDLASFASVRRFAADIVTTEPVVHLLINNAGVIGSEVRSLTADGFEVSLQVNYLGHFLLTNLLLSVLKSSAPSRIIMVTTNSFQWFLPNGLALDDLNFENRRYHPLLAYFQSKLCIALQVYRLHQLLNSECDSGISVFASDPGMLRTDLFRNQSKMVKFLVRNIGFLWISPELGANNVLYLASNQNVVKHSGCFFDKQQLDLGIYMFAKDDATAKILWEFAEASCKSKSTGANEKDDDVPLMPLMTDDSAIMV